MADDLCEVFVNEKPSINWAHLLYGLSGTTMLLWERSTCLRHKWDVCVWIHLGSVGIPGVCLQKQRKVYLSLCYEFNQPDNVSGQKETLWTCKYNVWSPQTPNFLPWKLKMGKAHLEAVCWHNHCTICFCAVISLSLFLPSRKSSHCWAIQLSGLNYLSTQASWSLAVV